MSGNEYNRYQLTVEDYVRFHKQGYLIIRKLVSQEELAELKAHTEDILTGRLTLEDIDARPAPTESGKVPHSSILDPTRVSEIERRYVRIHMLHKKFEIHERFLLHPRILDVVEALIGPDVMALQTMLFLKPPGSDGQGWHQDSYYIPTLPDTLLGAWLAIDPADDENGCLHVLVGSQHEPIHPSVENRRLHYPYGEISGLSVFPGEFHSATDESKNGLMAVVRRYAPEAEVVVSADPGDVVFFGGHILHRSLANRSRNRFRRAFVAHYANARSYTEWGGGNGNHILARGRTHLPFARPRFGTPCAALHPPPVELAGPSPTMMAQGDVMASTPTNPSRLAPGDDDL